MPTRSPRFAALAVTVGTMSFALASCAGTTTAPVTPGQAGAITQEEAKLGAEAHPQLIAEFGGAYTGPQASYVEQVGKNIAVQSGLANARDTYTVTLLNSSVNNAFAIPGGYIYTTRELVALMDNEAELAGVLGHEVGHVAARHAQQRQSAAQQNSILGAVGAILSGVLFGNSQIGQLGQQLAMQGSQLLTLKYSRSQETQADDLGIAYLSNAGYDPDAMATVLQSLAQQNALDAQMMGSTGNQVPEWASTHPDPASRVQRALTEAQGMPGTVTNKDTFLTRINGMMYGDDPKQGIVEGNTFIHPVYGFEFKAPNGFFMVNGTRAVSISGQSGKGQLTSGTYNGNMNTYIQNAFNALTDGQQQITPSSIQRTTVNGIPAAYGTARVNASGGAVDVTVFAYEFSNSQAFHFVTITQAGSANVFNPMYSSMRKISSTEAAAVKPRKISVVTVRSGDTLASLASRMAYTNYKMERFLVLNSLTSNSSLQAGQKVKIVTY
ncbi:M48 family metalloprotease [Croceicoccus naphthovorans]|uniref:Peptidase M48 Ste24p n=1 Tax=Croceicoccus naphthovorans TaxID=1348774 RepID=A0A0G3XIF0_9SPHN|nr:M48 family metalloprotease [Croceicoccus naphthovorans]AKM10396.1 peptidase M48 Ste24p [Croceicoccus naphthovorans]MBB3990094.1 putative Zn-dependent protease [Croceicoccus naphthovorans]